MSGIFSPLMRRSSDRQARINKLKLMIANRGDKTEEEIIARFCYEESCSIRIAHEYLKILELAGIIKRE